MGRCWGVACCFSRLLLFTRPKRATRAFFDTSLLLAFVFCSAPRCTWPLRWFLTLLRRRTMMMRALSGTGASSFGRTRLPLRLPPPLLPWLLRRCWSLSWLCPTPLAKITACACLPRRGRPFTHARRSLTSRPGARGGRGCSQASAGRGEHILRRTFLHAARTHHCSTRLLPFHRIRLRLRNCARQPPRRLPLRQLLRPLRRLLLLLLPQLPQLPFLHPRPQRQPLPPPRPGHRPASRGRCHVYYPRASSHRSRDRWC